MEIMTFQKQRESAVMFFPLAHHLFLVTVKFTIQSCLQPKNAVFRSVIVMNAY